MRYWWNNLDDDEKMTVFAIGGIALVILAVTLFFAIPRKEEMTNCKAQWQWTIQLQEYRQCNESKWGTIDYDYADGKEHLLGEWDNLGYDSMFKDHTGERDRTVPAGAYDIEERIEEYEEHRHEDDSGNVHYDTIYRYKYYYKIDRWCNADVLCASGCDKNPHEPECDLPTHIQNPQLGDKIRNGGHSEEYNVIGTVDGKQMTFNLTHSQWSDLLENDLITYKRRPLSSEIKDMQIGK